MAQAASPGNGIAGKLRGQRIPDWHFAGGVAFLTGQTKEHP